jgi:hypothetical protein
MGAKFKCPDDNITFSAIRRFQGGMAPRAIVDELIGLNVDRACAEKVVARVVEGLGNKSEEAHQADGKVRGKAVWRSPMLVLGLAITIGSASAATGGVGGLIIAGAVMLLGGLLTMRQRTRSD